MEINRYLENVLKSGEEKDTGATWYYGKLKDKNAYGFLIHVDVDGEDLGGIIPTAENYLNDDDFKNVLELVVNSFKRCYRFTMENKLCRQKKR